jgi:hypothetical protein
MVNGEMFEDPFPHLQYYCHKQLLARGDKPKFRRVCGLPVFLSALVILIAIVFALILVTVFLLDNATDTGLLLAIGALMIFSIIALIYPLGIVIIYGVANAPIRHINRAARNVHNIRFEGALHLV